MQVGILQNKIKIFSKILKIIATYIFSPLTKNIVKGDFFMKKIILSILCVVIFCSTFCSCTKETKNQNSTTVIETQTNKNTTNVAETTVQATGLVSDTYNNDKVVWGPGNIKNHARPSEPERLQNTYASLGAKFLLQNKKTMCLTFDEGYENGYTPAILDTLKAKNVKAIFFVTYDFASQNPDLIKRMIAEGHVVGNHTYRHYTMDEVTEDAATEEIVYLHKYIEKNYNYKMKYFRFPKGEFSPARLALAKELGYSSVFWSFAYADWDTKNVADKDTALKKITESTHPGAIFLLHAVSPTNAAILGDVIDNIRSQGYTFTTNI